MKILSLNGGGSIIYMHAKILSLYEQETGNYIADRFDRIHGVSAGAILGAMLATGKSAGYVTTQARALCKEIFGKRKLLSYLPWNVKYDSDMLDVIFNIHFGNKTFGDVGTRYSCSASAISGNRIKPKFWKSWKEEDRKVLLKDAVRASVAAPTYFTPKTIDGVTYVDGGLIANNPSMCALVDALGDSSATLPEIFILNLQSGIMKGFDNAKHKDSIIDWVSDIYAVGLYGGDRMIEYQCHALLGFRNHVLVPAVNLPLDSCDFDTMDKMAEDLYKEHREALIKTL